MSKSAFITYPNSSGVVFPYKYRSSVWHLNTSRGMIKTRHCSGTSVLSWTKKLVGHSFKSISSTKQSSETAATGSLSTKSKSSVSCKSPATSKPCASRTTSTLANTNTIKTSKTRISHNSISLTLLIKSLRSSRTGYTGTVSPHSSSGRWSRSASCLNGVPKWPWLRVWGIATGWFPRKTRRISSHRARLADPSRRRVRSAASLSQTQMTSRSRTAQAASTWLESRTLCKWSIATQTMIIATLKEAAQSTSSPGWKPSPKTQKVMITD